MLVQIEISLAELIDKITILRIKLEKIKDPEKLIFINNEYKLLNDHLVKTLELIYDPNKQCVYPPIDEFNLLYDELLEINSKIWNIEDAIRLKESSKSFDDSFVQLARCVYYDNDKRAEIKRKINELFGSTIKEIKSYTKYE